jgi:hypothetical protein
VYEQRRRIRPMLFYILVASLTSLVLVGSEVIILLLAERLQGVAIFLSVIGLTKSPIVGVFTGLMVKGGGQTTNVALRVIGGVEGSYTGLLVGGLIGSTFGAVWGVAGAIFAFVVCRYGIGPWLASKVGDQLESVFVVA